MIHNLQHILADAREMHLVIGCRGDLTKHRARSSGEMYRSMRTERPDLFIEVSVAGYDDDPRELPRIPEVARFVRWWAREAGITFPDQIDDYNQRAFLAACGAFGNELQEQAMKVIPPDQGALQ